MKVHCHLCGATLRRPHEFGLLRRAGTGDEIVVCTDERRCDARMSFDPLQGAAARTDEARAAAVREARGVRRSS